MLTSSFASRHGSRPEENEQRESTESLHHPFAPVEESMRVGVDVTDDEANKDDEQERKTKDSEPKESPELVEDPAPKEDPEHEEEPVPKEDPEPKGGI